MDSYPRTQITSQEWEPSPPYRAGSKAVRYGRRCRRVRQAEIDFEKFACEL